MVKLDLRGEKALAKALNDLAGSMNRKVIRGATRKAMKSVVKSAKENIRPHDRTGLLRKSIRINQVKFPSGVLITYVGAGIKSGSDATEFGRVYPPNYSHLLEFGTHRSRAFPWLRPAFDRNRGRINGTMQSELRKGMVRETNKARAKSGGKR